MNTAIETQAWWESSDVQEARRRARYDQGEGTLADVLANLLDVVDEREEADALLPSHPTSLVYSLAARDFVNCGRVSKAYAHSAITQLLDLGAEPERLKTVFRSAEVDRVVAKYLPWRPAVVTAARTGSTVEQIRDLVPGVGWYQIDAVLQSHGIVMDRPRDRRRRQDDLHDRVLEQYRCGARRVDIAKACGTTRQNVGNIIRESRRSRPLKLAVS